MQQEVKRLVSPTEAIFKTEHVHVIALYIPKTYVNKKCVQETKVEEHGANTIKIAEAETYIKNHCCVMRPAATFVNYTYTIKIKQQCSCL
jgi:hypothetical protein